MKILEKWKRHPNNRNINYNTHISHKPILLHYPLNGSGDEWHVSASALAETKRTTRPLGRVPNEAKTSTKGKFKVKGKKEK